MTKLTLVGFLGIWLVSIANASNFPRVDQDIKIYDDTVAAKKAQFDQIAANPQDKDWVKLKLTHMVDVDQYMRFFAMDTPFQHAYSNEEKSEFWKQFGKRFAAVDAKNTSDLKELLKIYQWFKISQFDAKSDNNAWLLVQHADQDWGFQKQILSILERLYPQGETDSTNYAYLSDRVASSWNDPSKRVPQKYGTQGTCISPGHWEPLPVEKPITALDQRRKQMGLGTEAENIERLNKLCH